MLYSERAARDTIRNREGKRVFYLGKGDQLTSEARDFLNRERIEILPATAARPERYRLLGGGYTEEKPEHMTHLHGDVLVPKTHPRIAFRGGVDRLEAELLLGALAMPEYRKALEEILQLARLLIRCDVLEQPVPEGNLCGLTMDQLRSHSHRPQDFYGKPHFMPEPEDGKRLLLVNTARCKAREAELAAVRAFQNREGLPQRLDLLQALNRLSSFLYLIMIQLK